MVLTTRNWLLYLLLVGGLIVAIVYTAVTESVANNQAAVLMAIDTENTDEQIFMATSTATTLPDRAERLRVLREKLAVYRATRPEPEVVEAEPEVAGAETVKDLAEEGERGELLCADYKTHTGFWQSSGLNFEVVEGARILYRQQPSTDLATAETVTPNSERTTILQLPIQSLPSARPKCLSSDVVGVAHDGSLLRNNEVSMYRIFGEDTHLGYALDGFPIYGRTDRLVLDACGGVVVDGQYRYHLTADRAYLLGCFAGTPITL